MRNVLAFICTFLMLCGCSMSADTHTAEEAVGRFRTMLEAAQFNAIYAEAADDLKNASSEEKFVAVLEAVHRKLGPLKSAHQEGWNVNYRTNGTFVTLNYVASYSGGDAHEQFVYRLVHSKAALVGYHINSDALILK